MNDTVIIIGGGISGLATAWFLHRRGINVTVLEEKEHVGGMIHSSTDAGYLLEHGPNSTLQKPGDTSDALGRLVTDLGLESRLRVADPRAARRYVYRNRQLHPLPGSPPAFIRTPLFSWQAKMRLLAEPFIKRGVDDNESIAAFVTRRLGREFLHYAVGPFISGVYAGDPEQLAVAAAVPRIHDLERTHGSLIRGAIALGRLRKTTGMPAGRLISFDSGMALLPQTIAERLPAHTIRVDTRVTALTPLATGGWCLNWRSSTGEQGELRGSRVVLALPAAVASRLLAAFCPEAATLLAGIVYAAIAVLGVAWPRAAVGHPLDGFGFLVPRREGIRTLGALFSSTLFSGRAPEGHALLTTFIGGMTDPGVMTADQQALTEQTIEELRRLLTIQGAPDFLQLIRHARAIPQYGVGHLRRLQDLAVALRAYRGLYFRGNWQGGVSVADCVWNAEQLALELAGRAVDFGAT
ncbi:MAG: protoporphyrinogen oxidase [Magnetococcales bacterium]|nr:protoporphyrinogen oxidase [Magnetococcales bacterium]